jgi:hypothetical protein
VVVEVAVVVVVVVAAAAAAVAAAVVVMVTIVVEAVVGVVTAEVTVLLLLLLPPPLLLRLVPVSKRMGGPHLPLAGQYEAAQTDQKTNLEGWARRDASLAEGAKGEAETVVALAATRSTRTAEENALEQARACARTGVESQIPLAAQTGTASETVVALAARRGTSTAANNALEQARPYARTGVA